MMKISYPHLNSTTLLDFFHPFFYFLHVFLPITKTTPSFNIIGENTQRGSIDKMDFDLLIKGGSIFCIFYGGYLYMENLKLKKQVRANTWFNYHRTTSTIIILRDVISLYKSIHRSNLNTEVLEPLIRVDSQNTEFAKGIIRQVQMFEPSFEEKDFTKWLAEGKVDDESLRVFRAIKLTDPLKKPLTTRFRQWLRTQLSKRPSPAKELRPETENTNK